MVVAATTRKLHSSDFHFNKMYINSVCARHKCNTECDDVRNNMDNISRFCSVFLPFCWIYFFYLCSAFNCSVHIYTICYSLQIRIKVRWTAFDVWPVRSYGKWKRMKKNRKEKTNRPMNAIESTLWVVC